MEPISPVRDVHLEGYAEEIVVRPGRTLQFMASGKVPRATAEVVRLVHGDPNPEGPGVKEVVMDWGPGEAGLRHQAIDFGSYIEIASQEELTPSSDFTVGFWVYPTLLDQLWQALAAQWVEDDMSFGVFLGGHHVLAAAISTDGISAGWCTGRDSLLQRHWQYVAVTYRARSGQLCVYQLLKGEARPLSACRQLQKGGPVHRARAPLTFGALPSRNVGRHWAHFNGKLGSPILLGVAIGPDEVVNLAAGQGLEELGPVLGSWDLSRDVGGERVVDTSGHEHHGRAVNAPTRAVTGPHWAGTVGSLYTDSPDVYDAIHLHEDDLADADWSPTLELSIPPTARAGIYAVRLSTDHDKLTIPFVVRPSTPTSDVCVLVPTFTWQAYSSNRGRHNYTEDGMFDRALCIYDVHRDGSMVRYCTRRKPSRSGNPSAGLQWGAHTIAANLYLVDWLEHSAIAYDTLTDGDLHNEGAALLEDYRCVILGSHHEYWTREMMDGLAGYLYGGGRVMYLGGNGLYWVTSLDPGRPYLMEVRRSGEGEFEDWSAPAPGELQHSTSLEVGGTWARRARPPRSLVGVEHSANVFENGQGRWAFRRTAASYEAPYRFVFEGVDDAEIGGFGLNLGNAAAYEMDSVQEWPHGPQAEAVLLARATSSMFVPSPRLPVAPAADIAITPWPKGGAVFAAGSVSWTGSLSHNAYTNSVARVTENVLRRFLAIESGVPVFA